MKRQVFPVLILLVVLLLPALTGCPQDAGDGGDAISSGHYGDNLPIPKSQVYTEDYDAADVSYKLFAASGTVLVFAAGNGGGEKLTEGPLTNGSFDIPAITAKPGSNTLDSLSTLWRLSNWGGGTVTINPPDAQYASLYLNLYEEGKETRTGLMWKGKSTSPGADDAVRIYEYDSVDYWYVDRDVTVTLGEGKDSNEWWDITYKAGKLELRKGWNALYEKSERNIDDSLLTYSLSVEDPEDLYWVLYPDEEF